MYWRNLLCILQSRNTYALVIQGVTFFSSPFLNSSDFLQSVLQKKSTSWDSSLKRPWPEFRVFPDFSSSLLQGQSYQTKAYEPWTSLNFGAAMIFSINKTFTLSWENISGDNTKMFLAKNSSEKVSFHDSVSRHLNFRAKVQFLSKSWILTKSRKSSNLNFCDKIQYIIFLNS